MRGSIFSLFVAAAVTFTASSVYAAKVNIVHGIDGRDLGAERALPVDVSVDGECVLTDVQFRKSALVDLEPGEYEVAVHPSDGECSEEPVLSRTLSIPEDEAGLFSAVVGLTREGEPELFVNDNNHFFGPTVVIRHFAKAAPVSVRFSSKSLLRPFTQNLSNGKTFNLGSFEKRFPYSANISANRRSVAKLSGVARRVTVFNIVGSRENGFTIIPETLSR